MSRALLPKHVAAAVRCQTDPLRALQMFDAVSREEGFSHTPCTFAALVDKLARHGHFAAMEKVLAEMRTTFYGGGGGGGGLVEEAYICAMRGYGRRGRVQEAADVFERMDLFGCEPSVVSYNAVMDVLVEHGFFDQAHKVYLRMLHAGVSPDLCTFAVRIKAFRRTRRPRAALRLLRDMPDRGFSPNAVVYCSVVSALYEGLLPEEGSALFEEMLGLGLLPEILAFNKLALALCNLGGGGGGGLGEAIRLLCKVLKRGTSPNIFTFNILLRGLSREGKLAEAVALLRRRVDDGAAADVVAFNTVVSGLCRSSRVEEAAEYLRRMTNSGCFPDSFTYNTVIDGYCRAGRVPAARQLLQDAVFKGFVPDRFTYGSLVNGLCEEGDLAGAAAIFREAAAGGLRPDVVVCNSLVKGLCRRGLLSQALEMVAEMAEEEGAGCRPDAWTYNTIVHGLCRAGRVAEAQALVNSAMTGGSFLPDAFTFNAMVDGLCRRRQLDEALEVVRRMRSSHGVQPDAVTYNSVLDGLCKAGRTGEVEQTFREMAASGCAPNVVTCNILIESLCRSRRVAEAAAMLARMRGKKTQEEAPLPLPAPDAVSFGTVIHGLCAAGELRRARELFREMDKDGHPPTAAAYNILIGGFAARLEPGAAAELFAEMPSRGCAPDSFTFRALVGGFCRAGDAGRALDLLREMMTAETVKTTVLAGAMAATVGRVINCLCVNQRAAEAVELVVDMARRGLAPPAAAAIFDVDKREVAAPKILVEELLRKGHITYHAYELLYDGVRGKKSFSRRWA